MNKHILALKRLGILIVQHIYLLGVPALITSWGINANIHAFSADVAWSSVYVGFLIAWLLGHIILALVVWFLKVSLYGPAPSDKEGW